MLLLFVLIIYSVVQIVDFTFSSGGKRGDYQNCSVLYYI